jgi:hypothetical protein
LDLSALRALLKEDCMFRRLLFNLPCLVAVLFLCGGIAAAQARVGTLHVVVLDPTGAGIANAEISVQHDTATYRQGQSGPTGEVTFHRLPFGAYRVTIAASAFTPSAETIAVSSSVPVQLRTTLHIGSRSKITVTGAADDRESKSRSIYVLSSEALGSTPEVRGTGVRTVLQTVPGFMVEDSGLMHVRGVDDGILYVLDGLPYPDRVDSLSASPFALDQIETVQVITGNIPAEFGGRSGAVAILESRSGLDLPLSSTLALSGGNLRESGAAISIQGKIGPSLGIFGMVETARSDRFLDPVSADNLHNRGGWLSGNVRLEWKNSARDLVHLRAEGRGARFEVPNDSFQQTAGQECVLATCSFRNCRAGYERVSAPEHSSA